MRYNKSRQRVGDAPCSLCAYLLQKRKEGRVSWIPKSEVLCHSLAFPLAVLPFGTSASSRKWKIHEKSSKAPCQVTRQFQWDHIDLQISKVMFSLGSVFTGIFCIFFAAVIHMVWFAKYLTFLFHDYAICDWKSS